MTEAEKDVIFADEQVMAFLHRRPGYFIRDDIPKIAPPHFIMLCTAFAHNAVLRELGSLPALSRENCLSHPMAALKCAEELIHSFERPLHAHAFYLDSPLPDSPQVEQQGLSQTTVLSCEAA